MMYLEQLGGVGDKYILSPEKDVTVIGRNGNTCDVVFTSCFVSRKHCEIYRIPPHGTLLIKSCTNTNPTYVDGLKLLNDAIAELRVGSLIGLGVPLSLASSEIENNKEYIFLKVCQDETQISRTVQNTENEDQTASVVVARQSHRVKNYRTHAKASDVGPLFSNENCKNVKKKNNNENNNKISSLDESDDEVMIIDISNEPEKNIAPIKTETSLFPELLEESPSSSSIHSRSQLLFPLPTNVSRGTSYSFQHPPSSTCYSKSLSREHTTLKPTDESNSLVTNSPPGSSTLKELPSKIQSHPPEVSGSLKRGEFTGELLSISKGMESPSSSNIKSHFTNFARNEQESASHQKSSKISKFLCQERTSNSFDGIPNSLITNSPPRITLNEESAAVCTSSSTCPTLRNEYKFDANSKIKFETEKEVFSSDLRNEIIEVSSVKKETLASTVQITSSILSEQSDSSKVLNSKPSIQHKMFCVNSNYSLNDPPDFQALDNDHDQIYSIPQSSNGYKCDINLKKNNKNLVDLLAEKEVEVLGKEVVYPESSAKACLSEESANCKELKNHLVETDDPFDADIRYLTNFTNSTQSGGKYSDSSFIEKKRSDQKRLFQMPKKVDKRPFYDSESKIENLASNKRLKKEPLGNTLVKKEALVSNLDSKIDDFESNIGKPKTHGITKLESIQSSHSNEEPVFDLNKVKEEKTENDTSVKSSECVIKREPNFDDSKSRVSKTKLFRDTSVESSSSDTEEVTINYSQIDEVILLSSDDEETIGSGHHLNSASSQISTSMAFPFKAHEEAVEDLHEEIEDDFDLPDLLINFDSVESHDFGDVDVVPADRPLTKNTFAEEMETAHTDKPDNREKYEDESSEDDRWWPILSQEFFSESRAKNSIQESKIGSKLLKSSPQKDLENIISKISSRNVTKSKLTEPKIPPSKTKRKSYSKKSKDKNRDQPENNLPSVSHSLNKSSSKRTDDGNTKNEQDETVPCNSKLNMSNSLTTSARKKYSKNSIRKTLLQTHNLDMYKSTSKKPRKHVANISVENNEKQNKCLMPEVNKNSRPKENISVQPKNRVSSQVKKGIAKVCSVNRSHKLTEVDLFGPRNQEKLSTAPLKYKIPKKPKTTQLHQSQNEIVDEIPVPASNLENYRLSNQNSVYNDINISKGTEIQTVNQIKRSILKHLPNQSTTKKCRVSFDETNLVTTKLIPPREARNCLGPKVIGLREKFINFPQSSSVINDHHEFISKVCSWNYDWLAVYQIRKKSKNDSQLPPLCDKLALPTLTLYSSFDSYKNTFSSLMYYEAWENIYKDWDQNIKMNTWLVCEVDSNKITYISNIKFSQVKAIGLIEMKLQNKLPDIGCLIVMKHKKESKTGYTFGYINGVTKRRTHSITKPLKQNCQVGANTCIIFEILFSKSYIEQEIVAQTFISISTVSYIRQSVRAFECLCNLSMSQLCPFILDPKDLSVFQNEKIFGEYLIHQMTLNEAQKKAVTEVSSQCFTSRDSPKISLIHGPPGTGKTRVIATLVAQVNLLFKEHELGHYRRILLCAPSNTAVDELVIKLAELKKFNINLNIVRIGVKQSQHPEVKLHSLDYKANKEFNKELIPDDRSIKLELEKKKCYTEKAIKDYEMAKKLGQPQEEIDKKEYRMINLLRSRKDFEESSKIKLSFSERQERLLDCKKRILMRAEVIATTLTSCLSGYFYEVFGNKTSSFACCIVDEAGQCKETETWFPLRLGIKKLILVGDHQQLPATVLSQLSQGKKLHQSLFERLYHHIVIEREQLDAVHCLDTQYRMHEAIVAWPAKHFYRNNLRTPEDITKERSHALHPYLIFDVNGGERRKGEGEIFNLAEVQLIRSLIEATKSYLANLSIGILTPYQQQRTIILDKLDYLIKTYDITVSTVDNFQGQERDVIFCSFVRSNSLAKIGFVSDKQRLNVSLTRARKSCFLICDVSSLESNQDWKSLIDNGRRRNVIRKIHDGLVEDKKALLEMTVI